MYLDSEGRKVGWNCTFHGTGWHRTRIGIWLGLVSGTGSESPCTCRYSTSSGRGAFVYIVLCVCICITRKDGSAREGIECNEGKEKRRKDEQRAEAKITNKQVNDQTIYPRVTSIVCHFSWAGIIR